MAGSDYKGRVFNLPLFCFFEKKYQLQNVFRMSTKLRQDCIANLNYLTKQKKLKCFHSGAHVETKFSI